MAVKTKAVGVRFPLELIERIERYQNDRGVNFTEALVKLVEMGLGGDEDETIKMTDERITKSVKQLSDAMLDERTTNLINDKLDAMLDERIRKNVRQLLDNELDAELDERVTAVTRRMLDATLDKTSGINIPSDDSSNFESIAEDVQVIQTEAIEQVGGVTPESLSYGEFHNWLGLPRTDRNKANGDIAIDFARSQGRGEWVMSKQFKFTIQTKE